MDDAGEMIIVNLIVYVGIPLFLLLLGWIAGRAAERGHFSSLRLREQGLAHMVVTDVRSFPGGFVPERGATLVMGEVVIATDYLKSFFAKLRNIFGGEVKSYESLLERGRREATLRMMEQAHHMGYDAVCNVRLGTCIIGRRMVEVFASGTAYLGPESGEL